MNRKEAVLSSRSERNRPSPPPSRGCGWWRLSGRPACRVRQAPSLVRAILRDAHQRALPLHRQLANSPNRRVERFAGSKRPMRRGTAPVHTPGSCPKSSRPPAVRCRRQVDRDQRMRQRRTVHQPELVEMAELRPSISSSLNGFVRKQTAPEVSAALRARSSLKAVTNTIGIRRPIAAR